MRGNQSAAERDIAFHLHPATNLRSLQIDGPVVFSKAEGVRVTDESGRSYIEAMSGLWCTALGFSNERLVRAAEREMRRLPFYHSFAGKVPDVVVDLAETLIGLAPVPMSKVFFANSGSEAIDTAVKIIWYYNNALGRSSKKKLIARSKAYHGTTVAGASLTGLPNSHRDFDLPIAGIYHTDCPHHYRFSMPNESEEAFASRCAENLEKLIVAEGGRDAIAAFFAEPVMGAAGVLVPPSTYFEKIQKVLKKYDILLVADEVICGFGRTGEMWGSQKFGLMPDLIVCAKALSSAYFPISAVMVNDEIAEALVRQSEKIGIFGHGFTYSGHPVGAAVALEALDIYQHGGVFEHVRRVAPRLQQGLRRFSDRPIVGEVRGLGLIAAVEFVRDRAAKEPYEASHAIGAYVNSRAMAHGLITRAIGDTIAFSPPLIITESEIDEVLDAFGKALADTETMLKAKGLL